MFPNLVNFRYSLVVSEGASVGIFSPRRREDSKLTQRHSLRFLSALVTPMFEK